MNMYTKLYVDMSAWLSVCKTTSKKGYNSTSLIIYKFTYLQAYIPTSLQNNSFHKTEEKPKKMNKKEEGLLCDIVCSTTPASSKILIIT